MCVSAKSRPDPPNSGLNHAVVFSKQSQFAHNTDQNRLLSAFEIPKYTLIPFLAAMASQDDGFSSKNWVWVPEGDDFNKGYITDYLNDGTCKVTVVKGSNQESMVIVKNDALENCNPVKFNKCDDMAELTHLNEPSVVYNLYLRYNDDLIYTYSGLFLVAINPYKSLPIYDSKILKKFHSNDFEKLPPHIFAIAENTYRNLLANNKDQSILVTGESGAGKTENTKKIIQYLSSITPSDVKVDTHSTNIDTKILQANPILESFGNAKTIKNNNSSRFGKFIKIFFSSEGVIDGATIDYYLLEKSRVVGQASHERNYHVFYQFLKGFDESKLPGFHVENDIKKYAYLSGSSPEIPNVDDARDFTALVDAFDIMGFSSGETNSIFAMLAVILLFGNLEFSSWKAEQASFTSNSPIGAISELLGISKDDLSANLLRPKVKAGREYVLKSKKAPEVKYAVDAFAKHLYEKIFQYIIQRINDNLQRDSSDQYNFIGVLDIAGFEIFEKNSFEQLCINYTNEKLQQFFNHHSFILEQSEYLREDIQWEFIDFGQDLQPTIDLIETKKPMGILEILNEECILPKSSDKSFMEKLSSNWGKDQSTKFKENKIKSGFIVHHYAGMVEYNVEGWIQKNTDPVSQSVLKLMPNSTNEFVRNLFENDEHFIPEKGKKNANRYRTASQKHKDQLSNLMEQLGSTEPHFVRCILPNLNKKPNKFDKPLVLSQLRCNGVLEGIRITRAGYPNKMTFEEFFSRYSILNRKDVAFTKNMKTNSELILKYIGLDLETYKIGITKLFFKNGILGKLEELRDLSLKNIFTEIQSIVRANLTRASIKSKINEIQASQVIAKNFKRLEDSFARNQWFELFINIKPLLEESVKVLDSKEMNENLKKINGKLKETENAKNHLELENSALKESVKNLEDEIINTTNLMKERNSSFEKLKSEEKVKLTKVVDLERQLSEIKAVNGKLAKEKVETSVKLKDLELAIEKHTTTIKELTEQHKKSSSKVKELELSIEDYVAEKAKYQQNLDKLKLDHQSSRSLASTETGKLREEHSRLKSDFEALKKTHNELVPKHETASKSLSAKERELQLLTKKMEGHSSLQNDLEKATKKVQKIEVDLKTANEKLDSSEKETRKLRAEEDELRAKIEGFKSTENELLGAKKRFEDALAESSKFKEQLQVKNDELKAIQEQFERLKFQQEAAETSKKNYSDQVLSLNLKVRELEQKLQDLSDKENVPPAPSVTDPSFIEDFANIKLKMNEQSAMLRKEKFENKRLVEEISLLKTRMHSSANSSPVKKDYRRSLAIGEEIKSTAANEELDLLKHKLEQEEANAARAEHYAIELQKKLNKIQATRGLNSFTDYEKKYKESQGRLSDLEARFERMFANNEPVDENDSFLGNSSRSLSRSESFGGIGLSAAAGANTDFVKIYQDITKTLRTTREELSTSKMEILRLKSLLRESEDELYEVKRDSFKASVSDYEQNLAQLTVRHDTVVSKNVELTRNVDLYKKRSDEYYKKLELAESAIGISKRHEELMRKEAESIKTELKMARDELKASQIVIKDLRMDGNRLEEEINDKKFEIRQLKTQIKEVREKMGYFDKNYGDNKDLLNQYKEEIRSLHQDVNFKLEAETKLITENKQLQLDLEDLQVAHKLVQEELETRELRLLDLEDAHSELQRKARLLENDRIMNERKISTLGKQVASLKELNGELEVQRDALIDEKAVIQTSLDERSHQLDRTTTQLQQSELNLGFLRQHLEAQRQELSEIQQELSRSRQSTSSEVQDYQQIRKTHLVVSEENDLLKRTNRELVAKVTSLEEKLYSNEQLRYWEKKVAGLSSEVDSAQAAHHDASKRVNQLERELKLAAIRMENELRLAKRYNDENFDYKNKVNHLQSTVDFLHQEVNDKELSLRQEERDKAELRTMLLELEQENLQMRARLGLA